MISLIPLLLLEEERGGGGGQIAASFHSRLIYHKTANVCCLWHFFSAEKMVTVYRPLNKPLIIL